MWFFSRGGGGAYVGSPGTQCLWLERGGRIVSTCCCTMSQCRRVIFPSKSLAIENDAA